MATFAADVTTRSGDALVYNLKATTEDEAAAEVARTAKPSWRMSQLRRWEPSMRYWVPVGNAKLYGKRATP